MFLGKAKTFSELQNSSDPLTFDDCSINNTMKNLSSSLTKTTFRAVPQPAGKKIFENRSKCLIDSETLHIENNSLKTKLLDLETENFTLKRKLMDLDQEFLAKEKNWEILGFASATSRMVPNLKMTFRKCQSRLTLKESLADELKSKMRTKRAMNAEEEIKETMEECKKLKTMLVNSLMLMKFPKESESNEERMKTLEEELEKLRNINQEYYVTLEEINKEIVELKSHEKFLEKTKKKKNLKRNAKLAEFKQKKTEITELVKELETQTNELSEKNRELEEKLKVISTVYEENQKKHNDLESQLKKRTEENEKVKNLSTSYRNALRKARTMNVIEEDTSRKLKNPPKFFKRIHKIITQKNMMIEVFLSLFDKYNKRILTVEEFCFTFEKEIKGMSRKFIENALIVMGVNEKYISLDLIEEWYNKYDYDAHKDDNFSLFPVNPIEIKRNSFQSPKETQNFLNRKIKTQTGNHFLSTLTLHCENRHHLSSDLVKVFDDIALRMEKNRIPKGKITETLLGDDFDESLPIFSEDLEHRLKKSKLNLNNSGNNKLLAQFLCEPEENDQSLTEKSPKFSQISKKLKKYTHDWEVFSTSQRLKIKLAIYKQIKRNSNNILKAIKEKFGKETQKITWNGFKEVLIFLGINFQEEIWRFWSLKFYPEGLVYFKIVMRKFKTSFPAEDSINLIKERKKYRNLYISDIFNLDLNGLITVSEFALNVKKLYLGLHSKDIFELICFIQEKFKSYNNETFTTGNLIEIFN